MADVQPSPAGLGENEIEPTEFPCSLCNNVFVTRMSLLRHMVLLHENDSSTNATAPTEEVKDDVNEESQTNEGQDSPMDFDQENEEGLDLTKPQLTQFPEAHLLEALLKNGSKALFPESNNGGFLEKNEHPGQRGTTRPVPNLKPIPNLIELKNQLPAPSGKNFQCQLCGVWFWKKEDLSRHVTRTHGSSKFTCPYCHRNISRRDHLKRHIKNVHPEFCTADGVVGPFANQGAGRPPKQPKPNSGDEAPGPEVKRRKKKRDANASELSTLNSSIGIQEMQRLFNESLMESQGDPDPDPRSENSGDDEDEEDLTNGIDLRSFQQQGQQQQHEGAFHQYDENSYENEEFEEAEENGNDEPLNFKSEFTPITQQYQAEEFPDEECAEEVEESAELEGGVEDHENFDDDGVGGDEEGIMEEAGEESEMKAPLSMERKFKCELCDASFITQINMERHMLTHSIVRPHKCQVCGKGFLRKEHLTKHLSSVHSGLKYRCQFCGKEISRKDHLLRHIRNCHPQEFLGLSLDMIDSEPQIVQVPAVTLTDNIRVAVLSCDMCNEIFNHVDELMEHQSEFHGDIRKFKCDECFKSFKRKEHLVKHCATHMTPPKSFGCSECPQTFLSLEAAHNHLQESHPRSTNNKRRSPLPSPPSPPVASLPLLECNLCDNTFQQSAHLLQHLKAYHGVSNPERRFNVEPEFVPQQPFPHIPAAVPRRIPVSNGRPKFPPPTSGNKYPPTYKPRYKSSSLIKPQIRSLLRMNAAETMDHGHGHGQDGLGSLMGLINRGSISLSLSN